MAKRVNFLIAIAKGRGKQIINNIEQLEYWDAKENDSPSFQNELRWSFPNGSRLRMYLIPIARNISLPVKSIGIDGKWTIYLLIPKVYEDENGIPSLPFNIGTRVFRKLKKISRSPKNKVDNQYFLYGPWSPSRVAERFPAFADKYLKEQVPDKFDAEGNVISTKPALGAALRLPIVVGSCDAEKEAAVDYRPTIQEIDDDMEADEKVLFVKDVEVLEKIPKGL